MKTSTRTTVVSLLAAVALITGTSVAFAQETKTLKEALKDKFLIGTAAVSYTHLTLPTKA